MRCVPVLLLLCLAGLVPIACGGNEPVGALQTAAEPSASATSPASSPAPAGETGSLEGAVIVLDPGHNGRNGANPAKINRQVDAGGFKKACDTAGASTNSGYAESAFTFDVAKRLEKRLVARGATVVLTRPDNRGVGPCITERAAIGNRAEADLAVSIHADGGPAGGRGFHVIIPARSYKRTKPIYAASRRLGLRLRSAMDKAGVKRADYIGTAALSERSDLGGLNLSKVPKVFLETGNMRNRADAALLTSATWRAKLADTLLGAIDRHLAAESRG